MKDIIDELFDTTDSDGTFQEDVTAIVYKNDKNEKFIVFGSGWITEHENGTPEYALSEAKSRFAPVFNFEVTDETREFKATDSFVADITLDPPNPIEALVGIVYEAMKVE